MMTDVGKHESAPGEQIETAIYRSMDRECHIIHDKTPTL